MQARHLHGNTRTRDFTPVAACSAGDVIQFPDGRAGVCVDDIAAGALGAAYEDGVFECIKNTDGALLIGGDAYWDVSASHAQYKPDSGTPDFFMGVVVEYDEPTADTTVNVDLNKRSSYIIDLETNSDWIAEENAAGVAGSINALPGGVVQIVLTNDNEVQANSLRSLHKILGSTPGIAEFKVNRVAASNNTVDIDFGIATAPHASDFESATAFAAFHLDGGDNDIDTHSDDNSTDRAPADSTINDTDATYSEYWIDFRDDENVKFYVDSVLVDTSASKRILTAAAAQTLAVVIEVEKTTGTATAEVRIARARLRTGPTE